MIKKIELGTRLLLTTNVAFNVIFIKVPPIWPQGWYGHFTTYISLILEILGTMIVIIGLKKFKKKNYQKCKVDKV